MPGDGERLVVDLDQEPVALFAQDGAEGVDDQLHEGTPVVSVVGREVWSPGVSFQQVRRGRKRQTTLKRINVSYGQLDRVLRSLGFTCRLVDLDGEANVYEDKESGALIILPPFPMTDRVLEYHLIMVRTTLDGFGIADPTAFAAKLQKVG